MGLESAVLATLGSPRRREILRLVWNQERSAGDIHRAMPDVTFGAISLHLRMLTETGLLEVRGDRQSRFYRARKEALGPVGQMLEHERANLVSLENDLGSRVVGQDEAIKAVSRAIRRSRVPVNCRSASDSCR